MTLCELAGLVMGDSKGVRYSQGVGGENPIASRP